MATISLDDALAAYTPDSATVRLVNAIFAVVPYAPPMPPYPGLDAALSAIAPDASEAARAALRDAAASKEVQNVVWMADWLDTGDTAYAAFTGFKAIFSLFSGKSASDALETDSQQRNDAVLKALGIAYMAWNAYPGTVSEKIAALRASPAGQALLAYFATVEVALPFADNALIAGANGIQQLFASESVRAQVQRLTGLVPAESLAGAQEMLAGLTAPIQEYASVAAQYVKPVAASAQKYLPTAIGAADKIAGVVANAADVMPVYRYLGARLAAEGAAFRAVRVG
jgi:hypothetical protein